VENGPSALKCAASRQCQRPPDEFQLLTQANERRSQVATCRCNGGFHREIVAASLSGKPESRGLVLQLAVTEAGEHEDGICIRVHGALLS
jgi:hypothetical protein